MNVWIVYGNKLIKPKIGYAGSIPDQKSFCFFILFFLSEKEKTNTELILFVI